jgi:hypothetical protein
MKHILTVRNSLLNYTEIILTRLNILYCSILLH